MILIGILSTTLIILIYYQKKVVELPQVFCGKSMLDIVNRIPLLKKEIRWPIWCYSSYLQFLYYDKCISLRNRKIANDIYKTEPLIFHDQEESIIAWGKNINYSPNIVVLFLHNVCGDYRDNSELAKYLIKTMNCIPVSYSRRGHSMPLKNPYFNTVGDQDDLKLVLTKIQQRYMNLPIYAVGSSAGSSLLAKYLGSSANSNLISAAALISPGYGFQQSLMTMPMLQSKLAAKNVKKLFLFPNKQLLQKHDKQAYNDLYNATSMLEWHQHQWKFDKTANIESYYEKHDPVNVLQNIKCPILYINAMDDFLFPKKLVSKFTFLTDTCPNTIIVHTKRGGHIGFYTGDSLLWSTKLISDFFKAIKH